eukprot:7156984-Alexandrium_andersonii.AAC.1
MAAGRLAQGIAFLCAKALLAYVAVTGGSVSASSDASSETFIFDTGSKGSLPSKVRWSPLGNGGGLPPQKEDCR